MAKFGLHLDTNSLVGMNSEEVSDRLRRLGVKVYYGKQPKNLTDKKGVVLQVSDDEVTSAAWVR